MDKSKTNQTLAECLHALLAYASAVTIVVLGGYVFLPTAPDEIMSAPWQIVLAVMAIPLLAAAAVSCGNHHENRAVRAATWAIILPLSIINPLA